MYQNYTDLCFQALAGHCSTTSSLLPHKMCVNKWFEQYSFTAAQSVLKEGAKHSLHSQGYEAALQRNYHNINTNKTPLYK